ncbi:hypothetical protein [Roseovarius sp.]
MEYGDKTANAEKLWHGFGNTAERRDAPARDQCLLVDREVGATNVK